jgi:hypothetical protein
MSDTSQGAGWWQASDGKWYPPEAQPQYAAVGAQTQPPQVAVVAQPTNGLAVASLVLSIVWISGLGSLLGIIFGFVARSHIKRHPGQQKGSGLALAGIIIGFVGILGGVLIVAGLVVAEHKLVDAFSTKTVSLGTTVNGTVFDPGIKSVAVSSIRYNVDAGGRPDTAAGKEYVAIHVTECATSGETQTGTNYSAFTLVFQGRSSASPSGVTTLRPDFTAILSIPSNRCVQGWISYEIAKGVRPIYVEYSPLFLFNSIEWKLSR